MNGLQHVTEKHNEKLEEFYDYVDRRDAVKDVQSEELVTEPVMKPVMKSHEQFLDDLIKERVEYLRNCFSYHKVDNHTVDIMNDIRRQLFDIALHFDSIVPGMSLEKENAITKLREAMMWINTAISSKFEVQKDD